MSHDAKIPDRDPDDPSFAQPQPPPRDPPGVGTFHRDVYDNGQPPPPPSPERPWVALWRNYIAARDAERLFPLPPPALGGVKRRLAREHLVG